MSNKLGYTFYPKDWRTDDDVFELSLEEKGFFRELIDECFLQNSQNICIKITTFCRKHGINRRTFTKLLQNLSETSLIVLIEEDGSIIQIPSVSKRLGVIKQSSIGGKKSNRKGVENKNKDQKKVTKENISLIEDKENIITTKEIRNIDVVIDNSIYSKSCITDSQWLEILSMQTKVSEDATKLFISHFEDHLITMQEQKKNVKDFKNHFVHWFKKQDLSHHRTKVIGRTNQI